MERRLAALAAIIDGRVEYVATAGDGRADPLAVERVGPVIRLAQVRAKAE